MISVKPGFVFLFVLLSVCVNSAFGQTCTTLGQTPATSFPVCGTIKFEQINVPLCSTNSLFVPGCSGSGTANYENRNPFWYRFTCFTSGTLGFTITPKDLTDDYDWQLYDVTGLDANAVLTNQNIIVSGNWAGNPGPTGTSATGVDFIQCASSYSGTESRFAKMPNLIAGHEYILLVSHFTNSQSGYSLSFAGGSAIITDPTEPHLLKATTSCDGTKIILKLNKKMKCSSLTPTGSEFSLLPATTTIVSAQAVNCSGSFDFDEVVLTLAAPLASNDYQLIINKGTDANSVLDNCNRGIPDAEQASFKYFIPQPIPIDSVGQAGCAPGSVKLYFSKKIDCSTIAADGSNFVVTGPGAVTVTGASGNCADGFSDIITVKFAQPIYTKGFYTVVPKLSVNGGAVVDECGQVIQPSPVNFNTADTVSSVFNYNNAMGCRFDTLTFSHNGAHDVNVWDWLINNTTSVTTPLHTIVFPASSSVAVQLMVSNGVCSDTSSQTIILDNEVIADFNMPATICPEDAFTPQNLSTGLVDNWRWNFDVLAMINQQHPDAYYFPATNKEADYKIKLVATNTTLGCSDSLLKTLKVLDNCFIAVPTAFTPNGDGLNDFLYPHNALKASDLQFKVFNRWGQMVFSSRNWQEKWNGKIKGLEQNAGVYVWFLEYTHIDTGKKVFQKGTTMLIR